MIHMEFLWRSGLSLSAMRTAGSRMVGRDRGLVLIRGGRFGRHAAKGIETGNAFFSEVSSRHALENPRPMSSENFPGRALFEISLILGVAGLIAVAAAIWAPILP
jgi:hypothetical protein